MKDSMKNAVIIVLCVLLVFCGAWIVRTMLHPAQPPAVEVDAAQWEAMDATSALPAEPTAQIPEPSDTPQHEIPAEAAEPTAQIADTPTPATDPMTMLREVIYGEREFYVDVYGAVFRTTLDETYLGIYSEGAEKWEPGSFAVVDFDRDGSFEVVLEATRNGDKLVLFHDPYDEVVYGYATVFRGMLELKKDGTYRGSSGAAYGHLMKLSVSSRYPYEYMLAESFLDHSARDENGEEMPIYYVNNELATYEEYAAVWEAEFYSKESAEWYDFTAENIELYVK